MISIEDSLKLALIKFKIRKIRNILSAFSVSIGVLVIIIFLLGSNALFSIFLRAYPDSLANRYFVMEKYELEDLPGWPIDPINSDGMEKSELDLLEGSSNFRVIMPSKILEAPSFEEYRKQNNKYEIKDIYLRKYLGNSVVNFDQIDFRTNYVVSMDKIFIQDELYRGFSFEDEYNGRIPILLPREGMYMVEKNYENSDSVLLSPKERFYRGRAILDKYIGKELKVFIKKTSYIDGKEEDFSFDAIIVGYHLGMAPFFSTAELYDSVVVPNWALEKNSDLQNAFKEAFTSYIVEFPTRQQRDNFYKEKEQIMNNNPGGSKVVLVLGKFEAFREFIGIEPVSYLIFGVGFFFLVISALFIFTTVGRIMADSKKEIGVFRAVGGQKTDIMMIFFSFTSILVTIGYVIGLVFALIFNMLASLFWGEDVYYRLVSFSTTLDINKPLFVFVGAPIIELVGLYLFTLLMGFLASLMPVLSASNQDPVKALREE